MRGFFCPADPGFAKYNTNENMLVIFARVDANQFVRFVTSVKKKKARFTVGERAALEDEVAGKSRTRRLGS